MAKRSQRHTLRYEKDRAGCMWGLISIFDFRHGRATRKLLADRNRGSRSVVAGSASSSSMLNLPNTSDNGLNIEETEESEVAMLDPRTSVKKLMEEEMVNEESLNNQGDGSEIDAEELNSQKAWRSRKNSRRTRRACPKPSNMHFHDLDDAGNLRSQELIHQDNAGKALGDLDHVMEELRQIQQKSSSFVKVRQDLRNDHNKQSDQALLVVEEKVNAAIEVFIKQRSRNSKHLGEGDKTYQSKEFMDALQTLSSNKDFILKLLQDPNSRLIEQIGNSEDAQFEEKRKPSLVSESNMLEENRVRAKTDDVMNPKQRKFFRRRSKSQDTYPLMEDEMSRPSSKIVILKPGPAGLQSPAQIDANAPQLLQHVEKRSMQNERNTSQFSFAEIKRKLKHAMGKDRQGLSPEGTIRRFPTQQLKRSNSDRGISGENIGWSSPNRDHFYTEKFAKSPLGIKRGDTIGKSKGVEAVTPSEASELPTVGMSNIYIEAKKHLVEMLDKEDETTEVSSGQSTKSLGRILSFPEYNSSPGCSPRENSKNSMLPSQVDPIQGCNDDRLQHVQEDQVTGPSPSSQDLEIEPSCSDKYPDECTKSASTNLEVPCENGNTVDENVSSTDHPSPEGGLTEETIKTKCVEEGEILSALSELSSSPVDREIQIEGDASEAVDDGSSSQGLEPSFYCLKEHPSWQDQTLSSPPASPARSSSPRKVEDPDSVDARIGRPSPVSVLEPLFSEDDVSPASTICRPADPEIQPRKIHFEEPVSSISEPVCPIACFENEESAFEYVEAVLLGSGLNWDEFLLRWLSSDQVLDPSLFDEVELFSSRSCHDQKLLFDCANEVLKVVCDRYFGCYPGVSLGKHSIRPVPKGMDLINEVWDGVEWYILQYLPRHSLDQLVKKDMERPGTWMNLRLDLGHIGVEMGEIILEELVEDTILSISSDTSVCEEDVAFPSKIEIESSQTSE